MQISETDRLILRHIEANDAEFLLDLYNQPAFLKNIGDRGVHSLTDAEQFIETTQEHYRNHGFWLYLVEEKASGQPIGVSGLIQRNYLRSPDIGFAIDKKHWRKGFAYESCQAIIQYTRDLGLKEVLAITSIDNQSSIQLLLKLGFDFTKCDDLEGNGNKINLYTFNKL